MIFRREAPYGCISLFIKHFMKMRTRLPKIGLWKGYLFSIKGIYLRGTYFAKMVYKRVRGWTLGQSLPVLKLLSTPPPPPGLGVRLPERGKML